MNNEEEIEIIDDVEESSVSVENKEEQPNTVENNQVTNSDTNENKEAEVETLDMPANPIAEVANETESAPAEEAKATENVSEEATETAVTEETAPVEEAAPAPTEEPKVEEPANDNSVDLNDSAFKIVDNNPVIDPTKEEPKTEEVKEEPVAEETNNVDLNDSAFKIVDNNPVIDPTKEEVKTEEAPKEEATAPVNESVIVPNENVTPQEIAQEPVVEEPKVEETAPVTNEAPAASPVVEAPVSPSAPKEEAAAPQVEAQPAQAPVQEAQATPQENVVDIKETATVQNQAGTTVIGQINGENVSTVSNEMPNSIDVSERAAAKAVNDKKNKQVKVQTPRQKITTAIIAVVVLLVLGGGGYFGYTYFIQNSVTFEAKSIELDLGSEKPTAVSYYITSSKPIVDGEYTINLDNVKTDTVGTYQYTITRKNETKTGTITVSDKTGPVITFKDNLMFSKNATITKDDLVSKCEDISNCVYEIEGTVDTTTAGSQEVTVSATDDLGNKSTQNTSISIIGKSLTCKGSETPSDDGTSATRLEDVFYFDDNNKLISSVGKKVTTFTDYTSYFALLNNPEEKDKYNFDRKTFSYWVKNEVLYSAGESLEDIQTYYTTNNYTCS